MRTSWIRITLGVLMALAVSACSEKATVSRPTTIQVTQGNCAGCLLSEEDSLFVFVVRTDADYDSLRTHCFPESLRKKWLPPRPDAESELIYVSLRGGGCKGCLDIVNVRETSQNMLVEVEGGFQGNCEMLIVPGAWTLIPRSDKPVAVLFHEIMCSDSL